MKSKSTSLYLPKFDWFVVLLKEINKTQSISSYLFSLAAEDLYARKLIKKDVYLKAKESLETKIKPRPALMNNEFPICKIYIKSEFLPLVDAIDANEKSRTSYFWKLLVLNSKLRKDQIEEFKKAYPEAA